MLRQKLNVKNGRDERRQKRATVSVAVVLGRYGPDLTGRTHEFTWPYCRIVWDLFPVTKMQMSLCTHRTATRTT